MKNYLVVERPERLEAPGAEFEILHGAVMSEKGLDAWAPRNLETTPGLAFLALAEAAKAKGFAVFALPTRGEPADAPGLVVEEHAIGERKVLVRHAPDWTGEARMRWQGADGGVCELEAPAWILDHFCALSRELTQTRGELKVAKAEADLAGKMLDGMTAECARLKAGMVVPPSARGRGKKGPASPAIASAPVDAGDGAKTVADVKADLAATLEKEAGASAPGKKKYRGSAGDD